MKHLSNYTFDEFKEMYSNLPNYIVEIVYDYYHRDRYFTIDVFADKHHISVATLYRYINKVKKGRK